MNNSDFTIAFTVDQTQEQAFAAIQNVRGWWSEMLEGGTHALGDEFTYRHGDVHRSRQKLVELEPARKIVWQVLDAHLAFTHDPTEWQGTQLCFEVAAKGRKTEVRFTHKGLGPTHECFGACSNAWRFYIQDSLRGLIATGMGQPDSKS